MQQSKKGTESSGRGRRFIKIQVEESADKEGGSIAVSRGIVESKI